MVTNHLVFLVEEPSMEAFLCASMPRLLPEGRTFEVHAFQGKSDLLGKLGARLSAYASWLPPDWRLVVIIDRDEDDCRTLKRDMENIAQGAGLISRSRSSGGPWQLVNRIAVEELEAWYFGDWDAVCEGYPRVPAGIPHRQGLRDPDSVAGGTWEAFERVLKQSGYFRTGLAKIEAARTVGMHLVPERSRSDSFRTFHSALVEAMA